MLIPLRAGTSAPVCSSMSARSGRSPPVRGPSGSSSSYRVVDPALRGWARLRRGSRPNLHGLPAVLSPHTRGKGRRCRPNQQSEEVIATALEQLFPSDGRSPLLRGSVWLPMVAEVAPRLCGVSGRRRRPVQWAIPRLCGVVVGVHHAGLSGEWVNPRVCGEAPAGAAGEDSTWGPFVQRMCASAHQGVVGVSAADLPSEFL